MAGTVRKPQTPPGSWPALMRAATAAAYVDEVSLASFLRGVGKIYPKPIVAPGKGKRWVREELDEAIKRLAGKPKRIVDLADELLDP